MYWAGGFFDYYEGHVSPGATQTGSRWVLAEGESSGSTTPGPSCSSPTRIGAGDGPGPSLPEGIFQPSVSTGPLVIPGNARLTVPMSALPGFSRGGIEVVEQGTPTNALVIEGAIYWHAGVPDGRPLPFGAGANWPATLIP